MGRHQHWPGQVLPRKDTWAPLGLPVSSSNEHDMLPQRDLSLCSNPSEPRKLAEGVDLSRTALRPFPEKTLGGSEADPARPHAYEPDKKVGSFPLSIHYRVGNRMHAGAQSPHATLRKNACRYAQSPYKLSERCVQVCRVPVQLFELHKDSGATDEYLNQGYPHQHE